MTSARHAVRLLILTLMALACAAAPSLAQSAPPLSPDQVVTLFNKSYGTADMDDIGPHTTAHFRDGRPITVWIIDVWDELNELEYEPLEFKILESQLNAEKNEVKVVCTAKIQTTAGTSTQKEIYLLILKGDRWLIDEFFITDEKIIGDAIKL